MAATKAKKYFKVMALRFLRETPFTSVHQYRIWEAQGKSSYVKGLKALKLWMTAGIVLTIALSYIF